MNWFQIRHNFQLAYILSFQKRYICRKKQLNIKKLFKKRSHFFQQISTSEPIF